MFSDDYGKSKQILAKSTQYNNNPKFVTTSQYNSMVHSTNGDKNNGQINEMNDENDDVSIGKMNPLTSDQNGQIGDKHQRYNSVMGVMYVDKDQNEPYEVYSNQQIKELRVTPDKGNRMKNKTPGGQADNELQTPFWKQQTLDPSMDGNQHQLPQLKVVKRNGGILKKKSIFGSETGPILSTNSKTISIQGGGYQKYQSYLSKNKKGSHYRNNSIADRNTGQYTISGSN